MYISRVATECRCVAFTNPYGTDDTPATGQNPRQPTNQAAPQSALRGLVVFTAYSCLQRAMAADITTPFMGEVVYYIISLHQCSCGPGSAQQEQQLLFVSHVGFFQVCCTPRSQKAAGTLCDRLLYTPTSKVNRDSFRLGASDILDYIQHWCSRLSPVCLSPPLSFSLPSPVPPGSSRALSLPAAEVQPCHGYIPLEGMETLAHFGSCLKLPLTFFVRLPSSTKQTQRWRLLAARQPPPSPSRYDGCSR